MIFFTMGPIKGIPDMFGVLRFQPWQNQELVV